MKFFIWNNGRSIFNIDLIARIYVTASIPNNKYSSKYFIVMNNGLEYEIDKEEYTKLIEYIIELEKKS